MPEDLKKAYHTIVKEQFPEEMEIAFGSGAERQVMKYKKVVWEVEGEVRGLRYGENPGQEAAFYRPVGGNLVVGDVRFVGAGDELVSDAVLHQFGKHPGKTNLTDADNALNILRYLADKPTVAIMKHNNPCGVARADTLAEAYRRADLADRVAAFGGCIACNRAVDKETAEEIAKRYAEVVVAPSYEEGAMEILAKRKNLRIMEIRKMERLERWAPLHFLDLKSLIDGSIIAQVSFVPTVRRPEQLKPAECEHGGKVYRVKRAPSKKEVDDLLFGWMVEAGVTSNSVLYVKDGVTVSIGTGGQDRVGVAEAARDKAYRNMADRLCFQKTGKSYYEIKDTDLKAEIDAEVKKEHGGLKGAAMVSDAFFPFRDGADVGLKEGVTAIIQPGGSLNDHQVIEACNEYGATMVFTGQRSFKH